MINNITLFAMSFSDMFSSMGLSPIIREPTIFLSNNILDLLLATHEDRILSCHVHPPFPHCCHAIVSFKYVFHDTDQFPNSKNKKPCRMWSRADFSRLSECLRSIDWHFELDYLTASEQYDKFLHVIDPFIEKFVPYSNFEMQDKVPWSLNPSKHLIRPKKSGLE